jgi:TolB-like protein
MPLPAGTRLGPYEILAAIGAGGMGEVYKAKDTRLGRTVAIKVLPAGVAADPDRRRRFEQEARAVSALNHPHICVLHDIGCQDGIDYLVMEHLTGETLAERLQKGPLPLEQALSVATEIADALAAAHKHGIIHRDLKPANAMLTETGVKLLDFGLAKLKPGPDDAGAGLSSLMTEAPLTGDHQLMGTVPYMAPEQLEGKAVDARSDVFALGCVLYEMLTGRRAFQGESQASVIAAIMTSEPAPLSSLQPLTPPALERVVRKCLARAPGGRWDSAHDVADELRRITRTSGGSTAGPDAAEIVAPGRQPRWRVAAVGVAGLVVLVSLTAWLAPRFFPRPPSAAAVPAIRSLAVLPFDNLMHDAAQDYFVDGMHESLITDLARLGTVKVTSRGSVMRYKGRTAALADIARELGVDAVIEGSVLRAGNRVRITAQLIHGKTDKHLWAENYDRDLGDALILLSEVSHAIAGEVQATLTPGRPSAPLPEPGTIARVNPEAYEAYLRGRHLATSAQSAGEVGRALPFYEEAARLDPTFAAAQSAIAGAHAARWFAGQEPASEAVPLVRTAAHRALALDPRDGRAYSDLGYVELYFDWNFAAARDHLERAVALNPHDFMIRHSYCDYFMVMGEIDRSLEQVRLGREMEPTSVTAEYILMAHLATTDRDAETLAEARRSLGTFPSFGYAHQVIGDTLWKQGRYEESLPELKQSFGTDVWKVFERAFRTAGPRAAKRALADRYVEAARQGRVNPLAVAEVLAEAGDADGAFAWLEKAYIARTPQLLHVTVLPAFRSIRGDPRYEDLLRRIGIPARGPASVAPRPQ